MLAARRLLIAVASFVARVLTPGVQVSAVAASGLSGCGTQA